MFSRRVPLTDVAEFCRVLRHSIASGVALLRILQQQSERGRPSLRGACARCAEAVRGGSRFGDALDKERDLFPPLFLALVHVGEETGRLPETFRALERYYLLQTQLRRRFVRQALPTVLQLALGILVITGLVYILGVIAASNNSKPLITVMGQSGGPGALAFLVIVVGSFFSLWLFYQVLTRTLLQGALLEDVLYRVPAVGACLDAFAMERFTTALHLTLDSGLSITRALRLSLRATSSARFVRHADSVARALKTGRSLHDALAATGLFSVEFLNIVESSEEGGNVPEMMAHQAEFYQEEAAGRLSLLIRAANGLLWLLYAGSIILAIFKIAGIYVNALGG